MNTTRLLRNVFGGITIALLFAGCGGEAAKLQSENATLRAEIATLRARAETEAQSGTARADELKRLQADAQDAVRLRGEVTQLRNTAKDADKLRAENQQLKSENQKLRGAAVTAAPAPSNPVPVPASIPRESWTYAGYSSPAAALVSAIYSMQQGNPKQYFDSLTPDEQARMTKVWEGKSAEEIAAKHVSDTSKITGLRVIDQSVTSDGDVHMNVQIEGVDRTETVVMKRVGNDWKFDGFKREPKP